MQQMIQPVMQQPNVCHFAAVCIYADSWRILQRMNVFSFDYQAYKRDEAKYLEQYKRKIEQNLGEDFDVVMKK